MILSEAISKVIFCYCPIFCESCSNCGGASRAISSLAPVPVWSCTKVHSRTVLGVKLDLAPRCIHRSQTEPFLELKKTCCVIYFN